MSVTSLKIRIKGHIPYIHILEQQLSVINLTYPQYAHSKIDRFIDNTVLISLATWHDEDIMDEYTPQIKHAIEIVKHLADYLRSLENTDAQAEFYIRTIRTIDQGILRLPPPLFSVLSAAKLPLRMSLTVDWNYDEDG